jgi:hypothetical protein
MQAGWPALPKFNLVWRQAVAAPMGWARRRITILRFELPFLFF